MLLQPQSLLGVKSTASRSGWQTNWLPGWHTVKQHAAVRWPRGANELLHEAAAYAMLAAISLCLPHLSSCLYAPLMLLLSLVTRWQHLKALWRTQTHTRTHTHTQLHTLSATRWYRRLAKLAACTARLLLIFSTYAFDIFVVAAAGAAAVQLQYFHFCFN